MEEATLHLTVKDLMECFRTNRRQGFIAGVGFMVAIRLLVKLRDAANTNASTIGEAIGTVIHK